MPQDETQPVDLCRIRQVIEHTFGQEHSCAHDHTRLYGPFPNRWAARCHRASIMGEAPLLAVSPPYQWQEQWWFEAWRE